MDNNQQSSKGGTQQPASAPEIAVQAGVGTPLVTAPVANLGVNNPGMISVPSALTGTDVSMTVPQYAGGKIVTTEVGSHA